MRIRQVKPEFFRDKDMAGLSWRCRVMYIGLWCIADDAGWLDLDFEEIGRELYGFDGWKIRERWVVDDLLTLLERGHIEAEPCGHAVIPTFEKHQRFSGQTKRVYTTHRDHLARCFPRGTADPRGDPRVAGPGKVTTHVVGTELGTERKGSAPARVASDHEEGDLAVALTVRGLPR